MSGNDDNKETFLDNTFADGWFIEDWIAAAGDFVSDKTNKVRDYVGGEIKERVQNTARGAWDGITGFFKDNLLASGVAGLVGGIASFFTLRNFPIIGKWAASIAFVAVTAMITMKLYGAAREPFNTAANEGTNPDTELAMNATDKEGLSGDFDGNSAGSVPSYRELLNSPLYSVGAEVDGEDSEYEPELN